MADDMLFIEHSHQMENGVSAFFFIRIEYLVSFYKSLPHFSHKKL